MKYKVPTNVNYKSLRNPYHKDSGCEGIPCSECILKYDYYCGFDYNIPTMILERLIEYKVITKAEAMDLMLEGNIK